MNAERFTIVLLLTLSGCLERRDAPTSDVDRCARCHGSAERSGDVLARAAPPFDLGGGTDVSRPGVGAHARHLEANGRNAPVRCDECHVVPEATGSPGHADDALPAEIVFGALARHGGRAPRYDGTAHACSGTYCHGPDAPRWTEPRGDACGSCHALPPPPPHPASAECHRCHGEVVDAARAFVAPDKHVDGTLQEQTSCASCHGTSSSPAPPPDLSGASERGRVGVGAHAVHLAGGLASRPVTCESCHLVPATTNAQGHLDEPPADVVFGGAATARGRTPSWDRASLRCAQSWCHGPSSLSGPHSPPWTAESPLGCAGCHGLPPPPPHPQLATCNLCHGEVVTAALTIARRDLHVDGVVEIAAPASCASCHGSEPSGAPPPDLAGNVATSASGVGAHRTHLEGTGRARVVACNECHVVPAAPFAPGHLDSMLPAEVVFGGVATAFGAAPSYDGISCAGSYCHGATLAGGTLTAPSWTAPPTTQTYCGSCHGLPPPPPHPQPALSCADCHGNIAPSYNFLEPEKHVDGVVDF
jgi:predicted CxxxxCH...CXXCH cytochrome family protein